VSYSLLVEIVYNGDSGHVFARKLTVHRLLAGTAHAIRGVLRER
jgi:hypothetical protein